ncbi:hypothetical protein [Moraxella caprae]|uniref:hypothetical protein n=1 Tax=Moraxella caprae TaxID=90240 RepID=UPI00041C6357|nr:hypothetical protein [Moraxella caprae]
MSNKQIDKDVQFIFDNLIQKSEIYGLLINPDKITDETKVAKKDFLQNPKIRKTVRGELVEP